MGFFFCTAHIPIKIRIHVIYVFLNWGVQATVLRGYSMLEVIPIILRDNVVLRIKTWDPSCKTYAVIS